MTTSTKQTLTATEDSDAWLRRFHGDHGDRTRLFCFPHAGGSAAYYFPMSRELASRLTVLAVQYPGRQDRRRERPADSIAELAQRVFVAMEGWTDQPFAFFGHSMGAIVAFEVARLMRERTGRTPRHLFVSGRRAPSIHRESAVHRYGDQALVAELARVGGTDERILRDPELRDAILPLVRSDYRAVELYRYQPGPGVDCPVTALVGDSDPQTTVDEASAWRDHCTGEFTLRVLPGGHFYLDKWRSEVIDIISTALSADHS
jgi:pyochelin biosynthesis protein PchC